MSRLRGFQQDVKQQVYTAWHAGARVVMPVIPTGGGKTVLMGDIARDYTGCGLSIAHRSELVSQISIALANEGVRHDLIAPKNTIRAIVNEHMKETGRSYYDSRAKWRVASVDTLIRRDLDPSWVAQVGMVHNDEGHHVLEDNKWGRAISLFPNAKVLLPTATPLRADGKGLGCGQGGLVDALVVGPNMRWMIDQAYLTDYEIRAPKVEDLNLEDVKINDNGEFSQEAKARVKQSQRIVGDVVQTYLKYARGKRGITFAVDVDHANTIAAEYNKCGVPAVVVHADTPDADRLKYMREFREGVLLQLVNVDLFGEGVDVPACQCVSMARPTASYGLYVQQFGRALRLMITKLQAQMWDSFDVATRKRILAESEKPVAMIFDHVGNVIRHGGPPDWRKEPWSLEARSRKTRATDGEPVRTCVNPECNQPYHRMMPQCPYCGMEPPPPADRSKPQFVDGDLILLTPEVLAELLEAKRKVDSDFVPIPQGLGPAVRAAKINAHHDRKAAQRLLREAMALVMPPNLDERVANRRFYLDFGVDTLSAQALGSAQAMELRQRILDKVMSK